MTKNSIGLAKPSPSGGTADDNQLVFMLKGLNFTVYALLSERNRDIVNDFLNELPTDKSTKAWSLFRIVGEMGFLSNPEKCKPTREGGYELKIKAYRFYSFRHGDKIIITNAAEKKKTGTDSRLESAIDFSIESKDRYFRGRK